MTYDPPRGDSHIETQSWDDIYDAPEYPTLDPTPGYIDYGEGAMRAHDGELYVSVGDDEWVSFTDLAAGMEVIISELGEVV